MYTSFFGLSDIPFSIAPNPHFLFKSDRHLEALAHLTSGFGETGGFTLLTGEVGTGKTTISRCVLENLPENTQVAFILNPTLSCLELLATLCDELKIRYKKTGATLKYLTDKLQDKLIKNHQEGINTLLIIDEAQHLQAEVLEQLRLLTNLETNTKKLLQVVLIGQPELQALLKRRDLRQLAQRITARYHLMPLTKLEVALYIKHRLSVVDCHRELFTKSAIKAIFTISKGIPRLINLLCERALMLAYGNNHSVIDGKTIYAAAEQVLGEDFKPKKLISTGVLKGLAASAIITILFAAGVWLSKNVSVGLTDNLVEVTQPKTNTEVVVNEQQKVESLTKTAQEIKVIEPEPQLVISGNPPDVSQQEKTVVSLSAESKATIAKYEQTTQANENSDLKAELARITALVEKNEQEKQTSKNITAKKSSLDDADKKITNVNLDAVDGVSDDLFARFQTAIEETHPDVSSSIKSPEPTQNKKQKMTVRRLSEMPEDVQKAVPPLAFEMHIYASDNSSWVRVNGQDYYTGDTIAPNLKLSEIRPQDVILSYRGEQFSLPALTNW